MKDATLDMGGTLGFLLSGDGYVRELLELQQGCEDPLEVPEFKCDYPLVASTEMVLMSAGGENILDFLGLGGNYRVFNIPQMGWLPDLETLLSRI